MFEIKDFISENLVYGKSFASIFFLGVNGIDQLGIWGSFLGVSVVLGQIVILGLGSGSQIHSFNLSTKIAAASQSPPILFLLSSDDDNLWSHMLSFDFPLNSTCFPSKIFQVRLQIKVNLISSFS